MKPAVLVNGYRVRVRKHPTRPDTYSVFYRSNDTDGECRTIGRAGNLSAVEVCELLAALQNREVCATCGSPCPNGQERYLYGARACGECARAWWRA